MVISSQAAGSDSSWSNASLLDQDLYQEMRTQLRWLEEQVSREEAELRVAAGELEAMKTNHNRFMQYYTESVGKLVQELALVEELISEQMGEGAAAALDNEELSEDEREDRAVLQLLEEQEVQASTQEEINGFGAREEEVRRLYRELAKRMHPDVNRWDMDAGDRFAQLQVAYQQRDLATILRLERLFNNAAEEQLKKQSSLVGITIESSEPQQDVLFRLEKLEKEYDGLRQKHDRVKKDKHDMLNSSSYNLYARVKWSRMCGEDLVESIRLNLERKLLRRRMILGGKHSLICEAGDMPSTATTIDKM